MAVIHLPGPVVAILVVVLVAVVVAAVLVAVLPSKPDGPGNDGDDAGLGRR